MTTEPTSTDDERAERVRRLQERRGARPVTARRPLAADPDAATAAAGDATADATGDATEVAATPTTARAERVRRLQEARAKSIAAPGLTRVATGPASTDERAERIRLLQERRGGTAAGVTPTGSPAAEAVDLAPAARSATAPNRRRRRRHAAPAGRVLVAGLSASAFLGGVAALGANPPTWTSADGGTSADGTVAAGLAAAAPTTVPPTTMPPVPPTVVVVQEVHHQVYVDESGRPLSGEAVPASPPPRARQVSSSGGSATAAAPPSAATAAPPPAAAAPAPAPPPPPPPPPPACTGSKC